MAKIKKQRPAPKTSSTNQPLFLLIIGGVVVLGILAAVFVFSNRKTGSAANLSEFRPADLLGQLEVSRCKSEDKFTDLQVALAAPEKVCNLDISFTGITVLPSDVGKFVNMREFRARGIPMKALPPEIGNWQKLWLLDVMDATVETLPPEIGRLRALEKLEIGGTSITVLPPEIGNLENLTFLDLMDMPLMKLPPEIGRLKKLKDLDIDETGVTNLADLKSLTNLERLIVDFVGLGTLSPEVYQLRQLKELSLGSTVLTEVSPEIGNLQGLVRLNLSNNKLTVLPKEIDKLKNLKELDVSANPLTPDEKVRLRKSLPQTAIKGIQ